MQELTIKQKLTNYYYFVIFNSILACVVGIGYWFRGPYNPIVPMSKLTNWLDILYIATSHFSIITLGVFIVSLIILPTIFLKYKQTIFIQFVLFSLLLTILVCDIKVFQSDAMHLFVNSLENFKGIISKECVLTVNKIIPYIIIIICAILLYKINNFINKTDYFSNYNAGTKFSILLLITSMTSLLIYHSPAKEKYQRIVPYMQDLFIDDHKNNEIINAYNRIKHGELKYPLKPLQITKIDNPPNILIIAMDAWRVDCFNEQYSPNLWQFAKHGAIFNNHFSGGNNTNDGLFSLFYGIPASYNDLCSKYNKTAIIFNRLEQLQYQIKFFPSSKGHKRIMQSFGIARELINYARDENEKFLMDKEITKNWITWHNMRNKTKPWFSFVFYDSLHGPSFPYNYSNLYKPVKGIFYKTFANIVGKHDFVNTYKTSVHYLDSLAKEILQQLKKSNDLDNTIVIITADHGCEWDDNNLNTWGYSTNFTDCQIQVPFAIIIPKCYNASLINKVHNITTHYDFAPTLMKNFLGIQNEIKDYSIGADLLSNTMNTNCHLVLKNGAGYRYFSTDFMVGFIKNNETLKFNKKKLYFLDPFNQWIFNKNINTDYLNQALEYITRFIKK